jgi:hypothetical protein
MAKEMTTHFPGKTTKQIRDKRKEVAYKKLLQSQTEDTDNSPGSQNDDNRGETYHLKTQWRRKPRSPPPIPASVISHHSNERGKLRHPFYPRSELGNPRFQSLRKGPGS